MSLGLITPLSHMYRAQQPTAPLTWVADRSACWWSQIGLPPPSGVAIRAEHPAPREGDSSVVGPEPQFEAVRRLRAIGQPESVGLQGPCTWTAINMVMLDCDPILWTWYCLRSPILIPILRTRRVVSASDNAWRAWTGPSNLPRLFCRKSWSDTQVTTDIIHESGLVLGRYSIF